VESLPRNILADTGPLFSLLHADDGDHEQAVEFARAFTGLLIATWPVIAEVSYLLGQSNRRGVGVLLRMIEDEHLLVADSTGKTSVTCVHLWRSTKVWILPTRPWSPSVSASTCSTSFPLIGAISRDTARGHAGRSRTTFLRDGDVFYDPR